MIKNNGNRIFAETKLRHRDRYRHHHEQHSWFYFDEHLIFENDRCATRDNNNSQTDPHHRLYFFAAYFQINHLRNRGDDRNSRGHIDAKHLESGKHQKQREKVKQQLHRFKSKVWLKKRMQERVRGKSVTWDYRIFRLTLE